MEVAVVGHVQGTRGLPGARGMARAFFNLALQRINGLAFLPAGLSKRMLRKLEYQSCIATRGTKVPAGPGWLSRNKARRLSPDLSA